MSEKESANIKSRKQLIGNIILIFVAFIWGTAFAVQRIGMEHIEPITFTAARMSLATVVVGAVSMLQKKKSFSDENEKIEYRKNTLLGGLLCGAFLVSASIFQQVGIVYTTAGKAGFITALYILLVPILSFLIFKKKNTLLVWAGVIIGVIGMYLLCMKESLRLSYGDALICVCAILFSGHILCCDHYAKRGNPIRISSIQFTVTAVVSWIIAFIVETPSMDKIISAAVPILYCGLISAGLGYTLQMIAQRLTEPTIASMLMSLESVFAVLGGAVLLNERMSLREIAGCIIMFIAIILVQLPVSRDASNRS